METVNFMSLEDEARSCEQRRCNAMLRGDASELEAMLADELIYGHSTGAVDTKNSYLEKIRSGANVYEELTLDVKDVVPLHQGVLVFGRLVALVRLPLRVVSVNSRFMTVWQKRSGAWLLLGHQTVAAETNL